MVVTGKNSDNMKAMREVVKQMNQAIESKGLFTKKPHYLDKDRKNGLKKPRHRVMR